MEVWRRARARLAWEMYVWLSLFGGAPPTTYSSGGVATSTAWRGQGTDRSKRREGTVSAGEWGAPDGKEYAQRRRVPVTWEPGLIWRDALTFLKQLQIGTSGAKIEIGKPIFKIKASEALRAHVCGSGPAAGYSAVSGLRG